MKKPTIFRVLIIILILLVNYNSYSQVLTPFTPRFTTNVKGDILVIGNNILNRDFGTANDRANDSYDVTGSSSVYNEKINMKWIDIDNDSNTTNSSSATLTIPPASQGCYEIAYAALYWSGTYVSTDRSKINKVKLKVPGSATYVDIIDGTILKDYTGDATANSARNPYACYKVITNEVKAAKEGVYTVANVASSEGGINTSAGHSAGWSIFVIYKDPKLPNKFITSFDGFSRIRSGDKAFTIPITGFNTNPVGPVNVKVGFSALEGDNRDTQDAMEIKGAKSASFGRLFCNLRPGSTGTANFFNSTINDGDFYLNGRTPNSKNTLGYDAGVIDLANPNNKIIANDEQSAEIRLSTGSDWYYLFFTALSVEVIEPKIVLTKEVYDNSAPKKNIGGKDVRLGDRLNYVLGFQNTGNDNAKKLVIRDVLPINTIFKFPDDIDLLSLPTGMSISNFSYDETTRTLLISIPDNLVEVKDPQYTIWIKAQVVPDCHSLSEACSNSIDNSAYATYIGDKNDKFVSPIEQSVDTNTGCILIPKATNFLVDVDGCKYTEDIILCKNDVDLTAAKGYNTYKWSTDEAGNNVIGSTRTIKVTQPGDYYVHNYALAPCRSIIQKFTVTRFGSSMVNPVEQYVKAPYAGTLTKCDINGKMLPKIFLCGAADYRDIKTNITDGSDIIWEKLNEASCTNTDGPDCANEGTSCTWNEVKRGPDYRADTEGQFRLTLQYADGCFNRFYFNVFKGLLNPIEKHTDIICTKPGSITIEGVPAGYQYALKKEPNGAIGAYQPDNIFSITTEGVYTAYIRQIGVLQNPCDYKVPNIQIRRRDVSVTATIGEQLCYGDKGSIKVAINDASPKYFYKLSVGGNVLYNIGPITAGDYTFNNLDLDLDYLLETSTEDGCVNSQTVALKNTVALLESTVTLKEPLTACGDGKIEFTTIGGKEPYYYYINSETDFQTENEFTVTAAGVYDIKIVDKNNCVIRRSITVAANPKPVYTIDKSPIKCNNDKGQIFVNVSNPNGYALEYSINGGAFGPNPTFLNLSAGNYNVVVQYTLSGVTCTDTAQLITIAPPADALTASGGVSELAGCRLSGLGGRLRITNVVGGKAPYQYSFDNGNTWQADPWKDVLHGTYILKVMDDAGCIYTIPYDVILDEKPADPEIKIEDVVYNCNGTGKTTATVINQVNGNYTYEYYIDTKPNTPITNNVFDNILSGTHTIKVKYKLVSAATYSNLLREDFGKDTFTYTDTASPDGASPGINPAFCWERQVQATKCNADRELRNGEYTVTSALRNNFYSGWNNPIDHTSGTRTGGRYLAVDAGTAIPNNAVLYRKTIKDIIPGQPIQVKFFATNLLKVGNTQPDASLTVELQNASGAALSSQSTGKIPKTNGWVEYNRTIDPGINTTLDFVLRLEVAQENGIDFAVDDIEVYQLPKSCITEKDFDFTIDSNKAFTVLEPVIENVACSGGSTGTITITAQNFDTTNGFYYSIDNGGTWNTSTTSPVIISGLTAKSYTVIVQSDAAGTCAKSFTKTIGSPTPVIVTASVTAQATCTTKATITADASGGTGPTYKYELRAADGITVVMPFQDSKTFTGPLVVTGSYTVVANDLRGCSSVASAVVSVTDPTPPTAKLADTSDLCFDSVDKATIIITATGTGTLTYSLDGAGAVKTNTFTNVGVGTHNVVVTDSNNCKVTVSNIIVAPVLTAKADVSKTLDCNTTGATIKVDITDGKSAYTYKVRVDSGSYGSSFPVTGSTFNYAAAGAGLYTFEISDSNSPTACKAEISATVASISNPTVDASPTNVKCFGDSTGAVTLAGSGGSLSYTYSFDNSLFTNKVTYTGLKAGISYPYQVKDSNGCTSAIGHITLTEPTKVDGDISATVIKCGATGTTPAVVTIDGKGGVANYTYSFNSNTNFTGDNTFPVSTAGPVTAYVKDGNGCIAGPFSITIGALDQITDINLKDHGYDCSTTPQGGHVTLTAVKVGTLANISYKITAGPVGYNTASNTTGDFQSLAPGLYTFLATDSKTGCTFPINYQIKAASDIVAGGSVVTTIKCNGGTGTIQFTVTGAKANGYDYIIKNGSGLIVQQATAIPATTTTITVAAALVAGDYTISVTDRLTKCPATYKVTLAQPAKPLDVTATAPNVNCNKYTVDITAAGHDGTPSYTYAVIAHGPTAPTVFGPDPKLSVNTVNGTILSWDVYVKDANGCTDFVTVDILKDAIPTVTAVLENQCTGSGNKFRIKATGLGGIAPLTYGINGVNGEFTTDDFFDVNASATPYTVWVKDANGCTNSAPAITVYTQLTASAIVKELDCSPTTPEATITVTPSGGKAPYKYEVSTDGGTIYTLMPSNVYKTATDGTFKIKVTDASLCTFIVTETILKITKPVISIVSQTNVSCNGKSDGKVTLTATGGSGGYTYSKDGIFYVPTFTFINLGFGSYTFYVKDSKGCVGSVPVNITQPTVLTTTATAPAFTCSSTNTKQSTTVTIVTPTTGTAPYEYKFNTGSYSATQNTLVVNDNGTDQTITYSVKDANGCTFDDSVKLFKLNPPKIASAVPSAVTCDLPTSTVIVKTTLLTGIGTLVYTIVDPVLSPANISGASTGIFTGLAPNATYTFRVTDASGCYAEIAVPVNPVTNIAIVGNKDNDAKCKGTSTGNGTYTVSGIATVGNYDFVLTAGTLGSGTLTKLDNTLSLNNVAQGSYTVKVTDKATGCVNSATIIIGQPATDVTVTATATKINCNKFTATITAVGAGGTPNYKYAVVKKGASAPVPAVYDANTTLTVDTKNGVDKDWVVYVMDNNGCTNSFPILIGTDPTPTVTATLDNQCSASGSNFTITATGLGGIAPLKYGINGPTGSFLPNNVFKVAASATPYTVWVQDANGCTAQAAAIMVYPQLTAVAKVTKTLSCVTGATDAQITIDITGGKSTYTYKVDSGSGYGSSNPVTGTQFIYSASSAKNYKFEITDSNSPACTVEVSIAVAAITNPTITIANQVNITCFSANNGSVKLKGNGGSGSGYTFSANVAGPFSTTDTFTGLTPGVHRFYAQDGKECPAFIDVTILEPTALTTTANAAPFSCNTTTNAKQSTTVTIVAPTTGTSPYEYSFNGTSYGPVKTLTVNDNGSDQVITFYVRDKNLCVYSNTVIINKLNAPEIASATPSAVTCTALTSTVTIITKPGTGVGNLTYSITAPAAYVATNTDGIFANLDPNITYSFKVVDENGCFDTETVKVNAVTPIVVTPSKLSDVKCNAGTTGIAKYTISGFSATTNYNITVTTVPAALPYTLTQVGDIITLTDLGKGAYTLSVVDKTTNCPAKATVTIDEPVDPLSATYLAVNANCKVGTSKVTVTALGGTLPYKYSFVHDGAGIGALTPSASANLDPAVPNWNVYVVDGNGCQVKLDVAITKDDVPTVTATADGQCLGNGTYTITASGTGTGTLQYSLDGKSYQLGATFTVTNAGTYNVWVKDANGCTAQTATPITVLDQLTISAKLDKNITCIVGSEAAKITLTVGGGAGPFAYTSSPATGTFVGNVFTTSTAGDYIFTVTDTSTLPIADRCTATTTAAVKITLPVDPHFTMVEGPKISCNGDQSGSLNITIDKTKGLAPFVINVYNNDTPKDYGTQTSGLAAGNYTVTITDAKGCSYKEDIEIKQPDPIVIDFDKEDLTCDLSTGGVTKGKIIINGVTGGTKNYDYYVTGINNYNQHIPNVPGTLQVFEVVDFGLYQIRVVDKNGCAAFVKDVLIAAPINDLDISVSSASTCAGGGSATVKILTAYAGVGPFHFNIYKGPTPKQIWTADGIDGWQGVTGPKESTFTGLTPGVTYTFIVYSESTNCYYFQVAPTPILTSSTLAIENNVPSNITCASANDGNVSFKIKNNYAYPVNVSYLIYQAVTNTAVVTPLTPLIPAVPAVPADPLAIPPVVGSPYIPASAVPVTGTIAVGGTLTVTNFGPLPVGSYYILVKETSGANAGCATASSAFNIKKSPTELVLKASATSIADCTNLGIISAQATEGTGPYKYMVLPGGTLPAPLASDTAWDTVSTFKKAGSVAGITYDVYAKDDYGCIKTVSVTVFKYKDPTIAPIVPICYDGKPFKITIVGTVDPAIVGDATYSINGSIYQDSPEFTFNAPGIYHLFIKDGKGCTAKVDYEVKSVLKLDAVLTKDLDCSVTDINSEKAVITLTASGGFGTIATDYKYEYSTDNGASWTLMTPTPQLGGLPTLPDNVLQTKAIGNYIFRATDRGNTNPTACLVTKAFTLDPIPTIVFTVAETNITCPGGSDGTITVDVTSGVGPYEYQLEKAGAPIVAYQPTNKFTGLAVGNDYVVRVRDAKLCFATENAKITIPAPLVATAVLTKGLTCASDNSAVDAVITVTVTSGGTSPYEYSFDGGTTFIRDNIYTTDVAAPITVIVKDGNDCETTLPVIPIPALNPPTAMKITGSPIYCLPAANQKSTVTINSVTGGVFVPVTSPLLYEILSPIVVAKQTSNVFANLDPSTEAYVFQVTDNNGCTYKDSFKVDPVVSITVSSDLITNVSCEGSNDGAVKFTVANHGTNTYTAVLTTGAGTLTPVGDIVTATGLVAGTYVLQVTDDITKCTSSATMVVAEPTALTLSPDLNIHADCDSDARVSVIASGGTAPYQYSFVVKGFGSGGAYTSDSEVSLNPTTATDWEVWVKDAHNCIISVALPITIVKDPSPTVAMPAPICFEGSPITIDLSKGQTVGTGLGPVVYTVNGAIQTTKFYDITAPGFYEISSTDINGCESNVVTYEVKPQLELSAKLDRDLNCDPGNEDAQFTLTASKGHGSYTYTYTLNSGSVNTMPGNTLTNGASGTYVFTATDAENCTATATIVVDPITPIVFTVDPTAVICNGGSTGTISVNVTSGNPSYEYQLEDGATVITGFQPIPKFIGLSAKTTYVVRVRDAKKCEAIMPVTITELSPLTAISGITTKLVCTTGNAPSTAVVTVTPSGGTAPYSYSYDLGANYALNNNTYETAVGKTFDIYVKDANGCTVIITDGVDVPALTPPTGFGFDLVQAVTCSKDATVDVVSVLGGALPLKYETIAPSPVIKGQQLSARFTGLTPGLYVFQVTDNNGCTHQESYTVDPVNNITVGGKIVKNASCNGLSDGAIEFTVENLTGGYTATLSSALGNLSTSGNVVTVTNLPAGSYTLSVIDAITDCVNTATVVVGEPAILGLDLVSQTAANCYLGAVVTVKGKGGSPLYKYAFVQNNVTPTALDFTDSDFAVLDFALNKDWDVYVQDANLICSAKLDVEITKDDAPTIDVNKNVYCYTGGPVAITIEGTTDPDIVNPPMYSIGNGYYPTPDFTLNAPGSYEFFIKDGNGCVAKATYVLRQELLIEATLTEDLNCTTNDATITLSASQGTGAGTYAFEYDFNNSGIFNAVPSLPYKPTAAGIYTFRVKDASTCQTVSVPVKVTPLTVPTFTTDLVHVRCEGDLNGSITVTGVNGVAPYEYSIDGAAFVSTNTFTGLAAGTYAIQVRDAKKCLATAVNVTIKEPVVLTASHNVTPFGCDLANSAKDAEITLIAHDGTGPYSYSFDNGVTFGDVAIHTFNAATTVNYVIVDINGCRATGSANVPAYNPPTHFDLSATPIYCNNLAGTATVTVSNITGGEPGYTYAIIEPTASATSNTTGSFANLLPGTYVVKVKDANGCSTLNSIEVKKASEISVEGQLITNVSCKGDATGSIAFTISNFITPANYTFLLSPNNGTFTQSGDVVTYTGLTAANYTFTVNDITSGCTDNVSNFVVNEPVAPLNFTMSATNITCINKMATITVSVTGGTPVYSYAAVPASSPAPTTFVTDDNKISVDTNNGTIMAWDVYVKDLNGCSVLFQTQNISTDPLPSAITANVTSECPSATGTYEIVVSATGKAPLQYNIGTGFQSNPVFEVNSSGSYDVTVKDGNGCTVTVTAAVTIKGALDLQLDVQALPSCDFPDGRIVAKTTGGSGNYKYSSGAYIPVVVGTTATFNNMAAGTHIIKVLDLTTGCSDNVKVDLAAATQITGLALQKEDVTCNGGSNGLIIVKLAPNAPGVNDNPVYKYTLTGTAIGNVLVSVGPQDSNVFNDLLPGDYTVKVTSGRGCNAQVDTRIIQPTPIVVNAPLIAQFNCTSGTNTTNFASITVNSVTGGTNPYVLYEFTKGTSIVQTSTSNVYNETDLAGGSYSVRVFDSKGCVGSSTAPIIINPFITMDKISVAVIAPITCKVNETIQVSVATTGGTPAGLVYTLTGANGTVFNQTNPTGLFSGLAIGNYAITVFNPNTGCTIKDFHYVFDANTFAIEVTPVVDEVCFGATDGIVDLTFVDKQLPNNAGAFTYTIIGGPLPITGSSLTAGPVRISGLQAGQYSITAKLDNSPECTVTNAFVIKQPTAQLLLEKSQTAITCIAGNNDGTITVSASGGWGVSHQYELNGPVHVDYSAQNEFTGLTAGTYIINAKDYKGCIVTTRVVLVNPDPIVVNATPNATVLSCYGDKNGIITVSPPTGGQGSNYMYTLNIVSATPTIVSGPQSSPIFTGLGAGTYTIKVTDGFACDATSTAIVISEPSEVKPSLSLARSQTCTTLSAITLSATGGSAPYTYSTDASFATTIGSFAISITFDVPVGTYRYFVRDAKGCTSVVSNDIDIAPLTPLTLDVDTANAVIKCQGEATGVIVANAIGGLGNYVYTLLNGAGNAIRPAQNNGRFEDLLVGTYKVKVVSGDCTYTTPATITINEPATPVTAQFKVTNVTCFGENNGKLEIIASGGTGIIKYAISPNLNQFFDDHIFLKLAPGDYQALVQDQNGCFVLHDFTVTQPELLRGKEVPNSMIPEVCAGDKDGAFSVEILGGTAPYSVSLDAEKGVFTQGEIGQTIFDFMKLTGGAHIVYFKDAAGCMNLLKIDMPLPVVLDPIATVTYECVDNAAANRVIVTVDESNTNLADIDYALDGSATYQASNIFTNLAPGNHFITARHTNGCEIPTASFEIIAVQPLDLILSEEKGVWNIVTATATGGSGNYEYSIDGVNFSSSNKFTIYKTDTYTITVRDKNGCTLSKDIYVEYVDVCIPNYFTPNGDGVYDTWAPGCTNIYNNLIFSIFDRYGRIIAKYHYGQKWDGRYNGAELPSGDYWYVLKLNDEKDAREFVGHFTLYR